MQSLRAVKIAIVASLVTGCATSINVAVDPKSISDRSKFDADYKECQQIAQTYDLTSDTQINTVVGAAAGSAAVAGIATAVAGAVFAPAIPFIIAGGAAGGGLGGGLTKSKETAAREKIMGQCLNSRGYQSFSTN